MGHDINWNEVAKSNKCVRTRDDNTCGNVISEHGDRIVIVDGVVNIHEYIIPKSQVDYYNGSEVYLNVSFDMLSIFEAKSS